MKNKVKKKSKVVEFPNLKQRILEKAMSSMKEKKFSEALSLFQQARENEYAYAEVEFGMVVCYMELGKLTEARNRCKKMLQEDVGDYFHVLQIYITILIQLKEYEEVKSTIEAILEEDRVPAQYAQTFYQLLEFARKMLPDAKSDNEFLEADEMVISNIEQNDMEVLQTGSIQQQYDIIQLLKNRNIRPILSYIEKYLQDEEKHPVLKTFLLHILKEQGLDKQIEIVKLNQKLAVIPKDLPDGEADPFLNNVIKALEDVVYADNPILFESLKELLVQIHTVHFPIPFQPADPEAWAAGLHKVGSELFALNVRPEELAEIYHILTEDVEYVVDRIKKLEEFSYLHL